MAVDRVARRWAGGPLRLAFDRPAVAAPAAVAALAVASVVVRIVLGRAIVTPWIMVDELVYSELAKSFADGGHLLIRDTPAASWSRVYPALISPAWFAHPMETTYGLAKAINALVMTSAAIPLYLWARRLVPRPYALIAVALLLVLPSFVYTGMLMTENAFLPAFLLACFAIATAIERPTLLRQFLALAAIVLAVGVRTQGLVLLLVVPSAILLDLALGLRAGPDRSLRFVGARLARFWPTAAVAGVAGGGYVAYKATHGASLASGLGAYQTVASRDYSLHEAARWTLYHFAELPLAFAVVPASAFLLLLGLAIWKGTSDPAERAFLAVTTTAWLWVVVEVAVFASRFSFRVEERYMFALAPLFLLAFVLWLARGLPRPLLLTAAAAAAPAALLATLPLARLLNITIISDTFGLIPFFRLSQKLSGGVSSARTMLLIGGALAALAFAFTPRRVAAVFLPAAMALFFVLSTYSIHGAARDYAEKLRSSTGSGVNPDWIDDHINRGQVPFLFTSTPELGKELSVLWQDEFWNRRLGRVYDVEVTEPVQLTATPLVVRRSDGRVVAPPTERTLRFGSRYVVANQNARVAGRIVAKRTPFVLFEAARPLRLTSLAAGVYDDDWTGPEASYSRFETPGRRPGFVVVGLSRKGWAGPDVPGHIAIRVRALTSAGLAPGFNPPVLRRWVIHSLEEREFRIPVPRPPFRVELTVSPTFSPADFGVPDETRQLGAQVSFRFEPSRRR